MESRAADLRLGRGSHLPVGHALEGLRAVAVVDEAHASDLALQPFPRGLEQLATCTPEPAPTPTPAIASAITPPPVTPHQS